MIFHCGTFKLHRTICRSFPGGVFEEFKAGIQLTLADLDRSPDIVPTSLPTHVVLSPPDDLPVRLRRWADTVRTRIYGLDESGLHSSHSVELVRYWCRNVLTVLRIHKVSVERLPQRDCSHLAKTADWTYRFSHFTTSSSLQWQQRSHAGWNAPSSPITVGRDEKPSALGYLVSRPRAAPQA